MTVAERIEAKVERIPIAGCWIWMGACDERGYGRVSYQLRNQRAHRVSYQVFVGPIPGGLHILHSCDVPLCVNPHHLRPGTDAENIQDALERGRFVPPAGAANGGAKIGEPEVAAIRAATGVTLRALGKRYGLTKSTVYKIRKRRSWRNVP